MVLHIFLVTIIAIGIILVFTYIFWPSTLYKNKGIFYKRKKIYSKRAYGTNGEVYDNQRHDKFRNKNIPATNHVANPNTLEADRIMVKQTIDNQKESFFSSVLKKINSFFNDEESSKKKNKSINKLNSEKPLEEKIDTQELFKPQNTLKQTKEISNQSDINNQTTHEALNNTKQEVAQKTINPEKDLTEENNLNFSDKGITIKMPDFYQAENSEQDNNHELIKNASQDPTNLESIIEEKPLESQYKTVSLYIISKYGFLGRAISDEMEKYGFTFNLQDGFFHYHLNNNVNNPTLFMASNMMSPGIFKDIYTSTEKIQGILLHMRIPSYKGAKDSDNLKKLFVIAKLLCQSLDANLVDESGENVNDLTLDKYLEKLN
ncbi:MAG: cell division protein ZipA C-terminal FtsZ-binding domain-containing protein [Psittacicella sp.]